MSNAALPDARLLASVCHDLRGPLGALGTWVHVLGSGRADEATRARALEAMGRAIREQSALIEQLSLLAALSSGEAGAAPERVELGPFVRALATPLPGESLVPVSGDEPTPVVTADAERLRRLVTTLLTSAVKGEPTGERALRVERAGAQAAIVYRTAGAPRALACALIEALATSQGGHFAVEASAGQTLFRVLLPLA